ncbi:MAG: DMT family transporter [Rhizobiaceae bacterium]
MKQENPEVQSELLPSVGIVIGGVLWGLVWLPLRALGDLGFSGAWSGAVMYFGTALVLLPVIFVRRRGLANIWKTLAICGFFTGAAFSFYSTSILLTDVVRAILLFYLTPVWGTLLGVVFLSERLTFSRVAALLLGLAGLLVVLDAGNQLPWPRNLGDWLALASGLAWAWGSLKVYQAESIAPFDQILAFVFGSLFVTGLTLILGGEAVGVVPSWSEMNSVLPLAILAALYVVPMLYLTVWPASVLTPGRIGLLLMSDVLVGVVSAALLAGEPFGLREALGTLLIVLAGVVEVLGNRKSNQ